jgi:hypothetical protein
MAGSVPHLRFVRRLRDELGCAIGVIHHMGKNEERAVTSAGIQGNSMFVASFDTRWIIAKAGESAGVIHRETKASAPLRFVSYTYDGGDDGLKWKVKDDMSEREAHELIRRAPATSGADTGAEDARSPGGGSREAGGQRQGGSEGVECQQGHDRGSAAVACRERGRQGDAGWLGG